MEIELLHVQDCPTWKKALENIEQVQEEKGIDTKLKVKKIQSKEEAEKYRFFGSPQVNIDGDDIEVQKKDGEFNPEGCRLYTYEGETYMVPPKGLVEDAIEEKMEGKG